MNGNRRIRLTYANVVASLALFAALGGSSYAAVALPKNSVGTYQLRKNAVVGKKIKKNAVTSAKVKDGSLLAADFKVGQLPAGPQGPKGDKGDPGAQGPKGATGDPGIAHLTGRQSPIVTVPANSTVQANAQCQAGELATGGGPVGLDQGVFIRTSSPGGDITAPNSWHVTITNTNAVAKSFSVSVVCAAA